MKLARMSKQGYTTTVCAVIAIGLITGGVTGNTWVFLGTGITSVLLAILLPIE